MDRFAGKELPIMYISSLVYSATSQWSFVQRRHRGPLELMLPLVLLGGPLELPYSVVHDAAKAATADDVGFRQTRLENHPGEGVRTGPGVREFEDEIGPDVLKTADAVLRVWLPLVLLE